MSEISIIIPVHNEEDNIGKLLDDLHAFIEREGWDCEIVVVDDNSEDRSGRIIDDYAARSNRVVAIHRDTGCNGMGYALLDGTRRATGELIVWTMGDRSDDLNTLPRIIYALQNGYDMVFGSRYMRGGSPGDLNRFKAFLSRSYTMMTRLLLGIPVHDITNAFRGFRRQLFEAVVLESGDFTISPEIAIKAHLQGFRLGEVPTVYKNRKAGVSKFRIWRAVVAYTKLLRYRLILLPGRVAGIAKRSGYDCTPRGELRMPKMTTGDLDVQAIYAYRFNPTERAQKYAIWEVLCRDFFQRYVPADGACLDLGAGYCEFINHIAARQKYAVDLNPDTPASAGPGVTVYQTKSTDMAMVADGSLDVVFCSNFFEHLETKQDVRATLAEVWRILKRGGRLLILQPNIRYLGGKYWDFFDHHIPFTHLSMAEALAEQGFQVVEVRPRFLPYTTKSRFPQVPALVRWYLRLPLFHRILGKQMFVVAEKPGGHEVGATQSPPRRHRENT